MPKVSVHARRINGKASRPILTRGKRNEILRKEHQKRSFNDEDNSSSSFNDCRMVKTRVFFLHLLKFSSDKDDDSPGDNLLVNHYTCDREDCGQVR